MFPFQSKAYVKLIEIIKENKLLPLDRYSFVCDTMSPKGFMLMTHILKNENIETTTEKLLDKIKGIQINPLIITKIMVGSINNRLYDKTQSRQYEVLISGYKYTPEKIINIINQTEHD